MEEPLQVEAALDEEGEAFPLYPKILQLANDQNYAALHFNV